MKSRIVLSAMLAAVLVMPVSTALGADQDVEVHVYPANTLAIEIQQDIGIDLVVGTSSMQPFGMQVTNTTSGGWQVFVDGNDLESFEWVDCDEFGCYTRGPSDPLYTIDKSNIRVTGGDFCWTGEGCDPTADSLVTAYSAALSDVGAVLIVEGTAWGSFGFGPPPYDPSVEVTVPADAVPAQYWTTLTYTIMAP